MSFEKQFDDLIEAGRNVIDTDFDPIAFQHWRTHVVTCLSALMGYDHAYAKCFISHHKEPKNRLVRASIKGFWSTTSLVFWCVFSMTFGLLVQPASAAGENNQPAVVSLEQCRNLAEDGNAEAQYKLGKMYEEGLGLPQDSKEAAKWYLKSAEKGCAKAQYKLGTMYTLGKGVTRDIVEAAKWFGKAAQQGYEPVKQQIQETAGKVNGDLLTNASKILQRLF